MDEEQLKTLKPCPFCGSDRWVAHAQLVKQATLFHVEQCYLGTTQTLHIESVSARKWNNERVVI